MKTEKKHGGPRPGAGRRPVKDKKTSVFAYVLASEVEAVGGKDAAKALAEQAISRKAKNILK